MNDDEEDGEVAYEVLEPAPFSLLNVAGHTCVALSGIASCVSEMFSMYAKEFGHAANHRFFRWRAKDEGEKFASDVLKTVAGLDEMG